MKNKTSQLISRLRIASPFVRGQAVMVQSKANKRKARLAAEKAGFCSRIKQLSTEKYRKTIALPCWRV
jgi:hypothetical protein